MRLAHSATAVSIRSCIAVPGSAVDELRLQSQIGKALECYREVAGVDFQAKQVRLSWCAATKAEPDPQNGS